MKIKLKNKDNPIDKMICFKLKGYCQTTIDTINSGKQVVVERVPQYAWEYVEEVKTKTKKESK
jgi:hypothetical protein